MALGKLAEAQHHNLGLEAEQMAVRPPASPTGNLLKMAGGIASLRSSGRKHDPTRLAPDTKYLAS